MTEPKATNRREKPPPGFGRNNLAWVTALAAIPLASIFGRSVQHWALAIWGREGLAFALALLFAVAVAAVVARIGRGFRQAALLSAPLVLVLAAIIHGVPTVEERVHFLLFGALAYTGGMALGPLRALALVVVMAFADEGLQWLLPQRHGDLRDVGMNLLGGAIGLALVYLEPWIRRNG